jgi:hypothetical protein
MTMTEAADLQYPPFGVTPIVLGQPNNDEPRLVVFQHYMYSQGIYKGDEAWVTGSEADGLMDNGALMEIISANSKHVLALEPDPAPDDGLPDDVTDENEEDVDELISLGDDDDEVPEPEKLMDVLADHNES